MNRKLTIKELLQFRHEGLYYKEEAREIYELLKIYYQTAEIQ